eukprot:14998833-Alexandrium_andersonii.AAC.1
MAAKIGTMYANDEIQRDQLMTYRDTMLEGVCGLSHKYARQAKAPAKKTPADCEDPNPGKKKKATPIMKKPSQNM